MLADGTRLSVSEKGIKLDFPAGNTERFKYTDIASVVFPPKVPRPDWIGVNLADGKSVIIDHIPFTGTGCGCYLVGSFARKASALAK